MQNRYLVSLAVLLVSLSWSCITIDSNGGPGENYPKTGEVGLYSKPFTYKLDKAAYGLTNLIYFVSAESGDDANNGLSIAVPFKTIQRGINAAVAGDIIYVMNGIYKHEDPANMNNVACFLDKHGTAKHWIMLANYPGHKPRIEYNGWDAISIQGSEYIIVSGFTVKGNADNVTYEYAYANRNNTNNPVTMGNGIGVMSIWNNYAARSHHVIIANNTVFKCPGSGIYTTEADYVEIRNNITCYNAFWSPFGTSGISMYQNWNSDTATDFKMIVSANVSYGNYNFIPFIYSGNPTIITDGNGIIIDDQKHTLDFQDNALKNQVYTGQTLIENNICFDNGGRGIHVYLSCNVTIKNNTCYFNVKHPDIPGGDITVGDSNDVVLLNNLVYSRSDKGDKAFQAFKVTNVSLYSNLFYGGNVDTPGPGLNSIRGQDPLFEATSVNPALADFRLAAGSPALDKCSNDILLDYKGTVRPQGDKVDIGAYEREN